MEQEVIQQHGIGGRRSRTVVVGDHACNGGGYTSGIGENGIIGNVNGLGAMWSDTSLKGEPIGIGGGYYTINGRGDSAHGSYIGWFGLGGCWWRIENNAGKAGLWSTAGSGGTAGQGGIVTFSNNSQIFAFNGNRITNDDYETKYKDYDKDGNEIPGSSLNVLEKDSFEIDEVTGKISIVKKKFIPAKIFIQDGIKRAVYDNFEYMGKERKIKYGVDKSLNELIVKNSTQSEQLHCILIVPEEQNVEHSKQGIGSGAGYIEVSNGTFNVVEEQ